MTTLNRCKCVQSKILFKKYYFTNERIAYKGTCMSCGLVRCWMEGKNYRLLSDNSPKGGDTINR